MADRNLIDVLTPIAACELFGKSTEAVRRATSERLVEVPVVLQFGANAIPLIALDSAISYWLKGKRASYMPDLQPEIDRMRSCGITFTDSWEIEHFRVLHPGALAFDPRR